MKSAVLVRVARALAVTDPDGAARIMLGAERIAQSITSEGTKARALADVARALAVTDPDRAERIAQSITDAFQKVEVIVAIAEA